MLKASAPRGTSTLAENSAPLVLLSAGIGVTPLLAMLHAVVQSQIQPPRQVWWIHSVQNRANHSFTDEVQAMSAGIDSIHIIRIYSRPAAEDILGRDYDEKGHLDLTLLQKLGVPQEGEFYLCGPDAYLRGISVQLHDWGVPASQIHFEAFGPSALTAPTPSGVAPYVPLDNTGDGPTVTFTRSGVSFRWNDRFGSLLEAAEACDVPVQWSCRTGVCHRCESGLIDGNVRYSPDPLDPPAPGNVLICSSVPVTAVELDI